MTSRPVASVLRAVVCVEEKLRDECTVAMLADAAGYSLYHFSRTFNAITGHSPFDYMMRRRLTEAARELILLPERRIIDIALTFGFGSHEAFSRAFVRMFQIPPRTYRASHPTLAHARSAYPVFFPSFSEEYLSFLADRRLIPRKTETCDPYIFGRHYDLGACDPQTALCTFFQAAGGESLPEVEPDCVVLLHLGSSTRGFAGSWVSSAETPATDKSYLYPPAVGYITFTCHGSAAVFPHLYNHVFHTWLPLEGVHHRPTYLLAACNQNDITISLPISG